VAGLTGLTNAVGTGDKFKAVDMDVAADADEEEGEQGEGEDGSVEEEKEVVVMDGVGEHDAVEDVVAVELEFELPLR
jgi:hypothetical protein